MRKVKVSAGAGIQEIKTVGAQSDARDSDKSALNPKEWQARADHPKGWEKDYSTISVLVVPAEDE